MDDFVKIVPDYDTQMEYIVPEIEMNVRGDFSVLIDESRYNKETSLECIYDNSWYYSYLMSNYGYAVIKNKMNESFCTICFSVGYGKRCSCCSDTQCI